MIDFGDYSGLDFFFRGGEMSEICICMRILMNLFTRTDQFDWCCKVKYDYIRTISIRLKMTYLHSYASGVKFQYKTRKSLIFENSENIFVLMSNRKFVSERWFTRSFGQTWDTCTIHIYCGWTLWASKRYHLR